MKRSKMSVPDQQSLAEALRLGRLSSEQEAQLQAYLAGHPQDQAAWEEEASLSQVLRQLPAAPVSSNFTARVLEAVRREASGSARSRAGNRRWFSQWLPKAAVAAAAIGLGLFTYERHQAEQRQELARSLAEVSRLAESPPLDLLENFDAIQRLAQVPHSSDQDLIAALSR